MLGRRRRVQVHHSSRGDDLVSCRLLLALAIHEDKRIVPEVGHGSIALGPRLDIHGELGGTRMTAEEGLNRRGMRSVGAAGCNRLEERQELLACPHHKSVMGDADDVGEAAAGQVEADGHPAGPGPGIIVRVDGHSGSVGEAHRHWNRRPIEVCGTTESFGLSCGSEAPAHHYSLGVIEPESGVDATVELDHLVGNLLGQARSRGGARVGMSARSSGLLGSCARAVAPGQDRDCA